MNSTASQKIASSMCARSVLSASLGSFIFFNKSELGSHFSSLSVLLCLIQIEIIGGAQAPPAPPPRFRRPWHCAFYEESTKLTGCVDFDTSMNIRYGATCEINTESQKFEISDILIYISINFYAGVMYSGE